MASIAFQAQFASNPFAARKSQNAIKGFVGLKESYFQQPNSLIKPFIEGAKIRQEASIQGNIFKQFQNEESSWDHQAPFNFAKTAKGNFNVKPEEV